MEIMRNLNITFEGALLGGLDSITQPNHFHWIAESIIRDKFRHMWE